MATAPSLKTNPGDELRDRAAKLLSSRFGPAKTEKREHGKKVDVYFEYPDLGRTVRLYVEAKDYNHPLHRSEAVQIFSDYCGILDRNKPSSLLIVTRNGLSSDADQYINVEQSSVRHQSILEIEVSSVDLSTYLQALLREYQESGLSKFYVQSNFIVRGGPPRLESMGARTKDLFDTNASAYQAILDWTADDTDFAPVALLGGYGSGKTSLATKLAAELSRRSAEDYTVRRPVLIKLGGISRYSAIDGILGGQFTSEFPVKNFNLHDFQTLNESGHFLIILDGFDEMKHSMNWSDFKAQVQTLLKLHRSKSKLLLLGRPSAFLSEDEERHILKGERRLDEQWIRLPDWPQFHELELCDFTPDQRATFVVNYLSAQTNEIFNSATATERARIANDIADADPGLFSKPVHSKLLTDLATDPNFDLGKFKGAKSRWTLYNEFIHSLYSRELTKEVRRSISQSDRIEFLRDLAFWLWTEKATSISFSLNELPSKYFARWDEKTSDDKSGVMRELLTGSILERKQSDIYFFGHRSFAEFLVADRMLANPPLASEHALYSQAFTDGVRLFLKEAPTRHDIGAWVDSFSPSKGAVRHHYINYLIDSVGGMDQFKAQLDSASAWSEILAPYSDHLIVDGDNFKEVVSTLWNSSALGFSWQYLQLVSLPKPLLCEYYFDEDKSVLTDLSVEVMRALVNSLFRRNTRTNRYFSISSEHVGLRRLAQQSISTTETMDGLLLALDGTELVSASLRALSQASLPWTGGDEYVELDCRMLASHLVQGLDRDLQDNFLTFASHAKSFSHITEVDKRKLGRAGRGARRG
jgi:hypothetical protein